MNATDNTPKYTNNVDDVLAAEKQHILNDGEKRNAFYGLAISGGGIRSASFGMGVLQALVNKNVLKKIDYLSTVSGGGYIGSSLTWFLSQDQPGKPQGEKFGTEPENFPFGKRERGEDNRKDKRTNVILNFIRQHGNYLVPGQGLDGFSLLAVGLRATLVSLFVYLSLLTLFMVPFHAMGGFKQTLHFPNIFLGIAALAGIFLFVESLIYSTLTFFVKLKPKWQYRARILAQIWFGRVLALSVVTLIIGLLPIIDQQISALVAKGSTPILSTILTFIGTVIGFLQAKRSQTPTKKEKAGGAVLIVAGAAIFLFGLLLTAYLFAEKLLTSGCLPIIILGGLALFVGLFSNTNFLGLHRMYRDRLMETFLPNVEENVEDKKWGPATAANSAMIQTMCQSPNRRPYHLINTNIVLADSEISKYHGRGGESFILSPLYCGSVATGWCASNAYMKQGLGRGMTLATAMAISGAAANPNSGVAGGGPTTNRLVSTLMSLLNIRMGYWAPNPNPERSWPFGPNFIYPGLKGGILSGGLTEKRRMIELTDGGHFENLGIYELIRRKVNVIIVSDGSADPQFQFDDLGNAIERVRVDFGALITFSKTKYPLQDILPKTAEGNEIAKEKYDLAKRGFAIGKIHYNDQTEGTLIYLTTTMVPGLPQDVYSYKSAHSSFPDQATSDQFFDERQFEAYRELGYAIAKEMLRENDLPENQWIK